MDEFLPFTGAELAHSPVLDDVDWDMQMDEFLPFIGAELIHSLALDDVDWDMQMDEFLPFRRTRTFSCPWAS